MILSSLKQIATFGTLPDLPAFPSDKESADSNWDAYDSADPCEAESNTNTKEDKCYGNTQAIAATLNRFFHLSATLLAIELCHFILLLYNAALQHWGFLRYALRAWFGQFPSQTARSCSSGFSYVKPTRFYQMGDRFK